VLRPTGRLVLSTPNHASVVERMKRVAVRHGWLRQRLPSMCLPQQGTDRGRLSSLSVSPSASRSRDRGNGGARRFSRRVGSRIFSSS
jgi:hypothetical protein